MAAGWLTLLLAAPQAQAGWTSLALGAALTVALHALRLPQPAGPQLTQAEVLRERAFSYGLAVAGVLTWHAIWCARPGARRGPTRSPAPPLTARARARELWEVYTDDWPLLASGLCCHVLGLGGLLAMRSFRSTLAPPACVALDDDASYGSLVPTLRTALRARGITRLWD